MPKSQWKKISLYPANKSYSPIKTTILNEKPEWIDGPCIISWRSINLSYVRTWEEKLNPIKFHPLRSLCLSQEIPNTVSSTVPATFNCWDDTKKREVVFKRAMIQNLPKCIDRIHPLTCREKESVPRAI